MKKLLYLALWNIEDKVSNDGVAKKVIEQAQTFLDIGYEADVVMRNETRMLVFSIPDNNVKEFQMKSSHVLPQRKYFYKSVFDYLPVDQYDVIYIRYQLADIYFCRLLEHLYRTKKDSTPILVEIPSYPYVGECRHDFKKRVLYIQDVIHRKKLKLWVDRIVTLEKSDQIFGIPTLYIQNGVFLQGYRLKKQNQSKSLNFCCAAQFAAWHGIDRLLRGIAQYKKHSYPECPVHLYLAGEGPELNNLQKITNQLGLQSEVTFCGKLNQKQLYEQLYDRCDIGVECLALFRRSENAISSSLKSREYLAVGMPFIYSGKIDVLEQNAADFVFEIPSSEEPVDIQSVIDEYNKLLQKETKKELSARIRTYANQCVSWQTTMSEVVEWIQQDKKGE